MNAVDSVFQRALSKLLTEIFDGPPGDEAFVLNPGDPGLLAQLDTLDAAAASSRRMPGKTTIAAHVDHIQYGLSLLNRWAQGEANPWGTADWNASWQRPTVSPETWQALVSDCVRKRQRGKRSWPPSQIGMNWLPPAPWQVPLIRRITSVRSARYWPAWN